MSEDEDSYEIPLQDQRVFGAGLKRTRVKFVPSSTPSAARATANPTRSIGDLYLNLVLPKDKRLPSPESKTPPSISLNEPEICEICKLPFSDSSITNNGPTDEADSSSIGQPIFPKARPHEASLAHQVCLTHSHPPSHLDRNRKGLAYLSQYGWDPDSRLGLGASGQGIQFPIKAKPKDDKLGLGVILPKEVDRRRKKKPETLDAGKVRKLHDKDRKTSERLREMFYRNDDVERYLGGG